MRDTPTPVPLVRLPAGLDLLADASGGVLTAGLSQASRHASRVTDRIKPCGRCHARTRRQSVAAR